MYKYLTIQNPTILWPYGLDRFLGRFGFGFSLFTQLVGMDQNCWRAGTWIYTKGCHQQKLLAEIARISKLYTIASWCWKHPRLNCKSRLWAHRKQQHLLRHTSKLYEHVCHELVLETTRISPPNHGQYTAMKLIFLVFINIFRFLGN